MSSGSGLIAECELALEKREASALIAVADLVTQSEFATGPSPVVLRVLIEGGRWDLARELIAESSGEGEVTSFLACIARRARSVAPSDLSSGPLLAANEWIDGRVGPAVNAASIALLRDPSDVNALFVKAWGLREQGYLPAAAKALSAMRGLDLYPFDVVEAAALAVHIAFDRNEDASRFVGEFRAAIAIPNLPPAAQRFVDLLDLGVSWRTGDQLRVDMLLQRLRGVAWAEPHVLASQRGKNGGGGKGPKGARLRSEIALLLRRAEYASRADARALVEEALDLAESADVVAPVLEFAGEAAPVVIQAAMQRSSGTSARIVSLLSERNEQPEKPLNQRELLVMRLFASGRKVRDIADALEISSDTVKSHSHHVLTKLGVGSRAEAIERLRNRGILP